MTENTLFSRGNPYSVIAPSGAYSASEGEFVISDGSEITLPPPVQDGVVVVRGPANQTIRVVPSSGQVQLQNNGIAIQNGTDTVFVSDGTNWYVRNQSNFFGLDIPDSVVTQYTFEDQTDPTADTVGSNDGSLIGSVGFDTSNPRCNSVAADLNGGFIESASTTDISASGSTDGASVATFINADSTPVDFGTAAQWATGNNNMLRVRYDSGGSQWVAQLRVSGNDASAFSGVDAQTSQYQHVVAAADQNDVRIIIDGVEEARQSHSLNLSNIGSAPLRFGAFDGSQGLEIPGLYDNATAADAGLSESEAQQLINQC